jgi:hypothetical protein
MEADLGGLEGRCEAAAWGWVAMYRLLSIGVFLLWVTAMVSLVVRDVLPGWTAQDPPPITGDHFKLLDEPRQQFGMFNGQNRRLGTAWSDVQVTSGATSVYGTVVLDGLTFIPRVRINTTTSFDTTGALETFDMQVLGVLDQKIVVQGERRGIYFPVVMQFGPIRREVNLDFSASRMIGESLRPFGYLPTLRVGQSWRMQILDPVAAVMTGRTDFKSVVATVTGKETIRHPTQEGETVDCFVVETSPTRSKAWVDANGTVFRQEVEMPGLGRVVLMKEKYERSETDLENGLKHTGGAAEHAGD